MSLRTTLLLIAFLLSSSANSTEPGDRRHLRDIPDFTQTDVKGDAFGNGQQFCAPAAVSNSLLWLGGRSAGQKALVTLLASERYMNTDLKTGSGTTELRRGVDRYVKEELGGYRTLVYQGWRKHPAAFSSHVRVPTLDFISRGVDGRSAAWINVGWYKVDAASKEYQRIGGHWVTLVGFDFGDNQLIVNDPAPRAGRTKSSEYVSFRALTGGRLTGRKSGLPTDARGYLQLARGMHLHSKADTAIIDGVVLLEL